MVLGRGAERPSEGLSENYSCCTSNHKVLVGSLISYFVGERPVLATGLPQSNKCNAECPDKYIIEDLATSLCPVCW